MSVSATSRPRSPGNTGGSPSGVGLNKPAATGDAEALKVCIVDNDAAIRDSLSFLIESEHIPVVTFASAREFLDSWDPDHTGCVLVDIRMPGMSGLELQTELSRQEVTVPVIMITGFADVQMAVQSMKKGAFDFIEKPIHHQLLLDRLHQALSEVAGARKEARQKAEFQRRYKRLSKTQREVLELVVRGFTSPQISDSLGCSIKTVEVHRSHIYSRLGCKNVAVVVRMVMAQRIFDEEEMAP